MGFLCAGYFFWRRSRYAKQAAKPRGTLVRTLLTTPPPKEHSYANLVSYAGYLWIDGSTYGDATSFPGFSPTRRWERG